MLSRLGTNAQIGKPFSVVRNNQALDQLEATFEALVGHGVISGGVVSVTTGRTVKVPSGTVFLVQGVLYTLAADATITLPASTTGTLYGQIVRTAANVDNKGDSDTYALSLVTAAPASGLYNTLVLFVTGLSSVTSLTEPASGKRALLQLPKLVRTVTATGSLNTDDGTIYADATAGAIVLTLPAASAALREIRVMKIDASANTVTVQRAGADTINGATTSVLSTQYAGKSYVPDGSAFWGAF